MKKYIDLHTDFLLSFHEKGREYNSKLQINENSISTAKLVFSGFSYNDMWKDTNKQLDSLLNKIKESENLVQVLDQKNLKQALKNESTTGIIHHMEGAAVIDSEQKLEEYFQKGVRSVGLGYNEASSLTSGCLSSPDEGLTKLGKQIIRKMNSLGILLDLSHISKKAFFESVDISETAPFISHGNSKALCNLPRNYSDEQLEKIRELDSIIGVFFSTKFVKKKKGVDVNDVIDHIVYISDIIGTEHVSIGSDFGGITTGLPKGLENIGKIFNVEKELRKRGFIKTEIENILYANAKRYLEKYLP